MRTPSLKEFKHFAKTHYNLAHAVCMAQAFAQLERERVDAYIKPIFELCDFYPDEKFIERGEPRERITDIQHLYITDLESDQYKWFMEQCDIEHRKHGFDGPQGYCPALVAESLKIDAENALIKAGCEFLGIESGTILSLEHRAKMLDLLLGACLKDKKAA